MWEDDSEAYLNYSKFNAQKCHIRCINHAINLVFSIFVKNNKMEVSCISCSMLFWTENGESFCSFCSPSRQHKIGKKERYTHDYEYKEFKASMKNHGKKYNENRSKKYAVDT